MNKSLLLCARDIELSYFRGIPLKPAIRQMQYLLAPYEVSRATKELARLERGKTAQYEQYTSDLLNKSYHVKKMKGAK
jgi:DNA-binding LytR/AlgR family response regulator